MRLTPQNPMNRALVANLIFETIVFALAVAGMIQVDDASVALAFGACGAAMALALISASRWRSTWGWYLGWVTQVVAVGLGLLSPWMYGVGGVFAGLHVVIYVLGRRLDRQSAPTGQGVA
ncbi:MAG: DUF4233 domain-containing protein [Propioniciclava sp.]